MYPGYLAKKHEDRPAFIMASTGETVTYREFEERSNQLAHFLRDEGLEKGCLLYTSPSPRDGLLSRMPSSA